MVFNIVYLALIISVIWLFALTIMLWKIYSHYNNLATRTDKKALNSLLDDLLKDVDLFKKELENVKGQCVKIEKNNLLHIQKIGLLRFNPFKDTGGDQSFILAFVDANDTGVVISGLYSRSGTRWYAKRIVMGKGIEHELSDEEKKAVKEAKNHN